MRYALIALFLLPVVAFAGPPDSTVKIRSTAPRDAYGRIMDSVGTGTAVGNEGELTLILTNHHVAPQKRDYSIEHKGQKYTDVTWLGSDRSRDLAALVVRKKLPIATIAKTDAGPRFPTEHAGHPHGNGMQIKNGSTLGYTGRLMKCGCDGYELRVPCFGGESGSGVYHARSNELFAVISEATSDGHPYTFAIGTTDVRAFLRKHCTLFPTLSESLALVPGVNGRTYNDALAEARETGKPLVTFVGVEACPIEGAIVCEPWQLRPYKRGDVVVSVWNGDKHVGEVYKDDPTNADRILAFAKKLTEK